MHSSSYYSTVNVHLLKPGFEYPERSFTRRDALYYPSRDIVFIATKPSSSHEGEVYSEVAIWEPDEIRLLGTLTLSVPENGGWVAYCPWDLSFTSSPVVPHLPNTLDLSSDDGILSCLDYARSLLAQKLEETSSSYIFRSQQSLPRSDAETERQLFENIDPLNSLLIRGLYHLIKCPLLLFTYPSYPMFSEEAFINLQISTEAALQIIRERLRTKESSNPSIEDVHKYIQSNFDQGLSWVEYLEEQYEKWIETKHPLSVYGSGWAPSIFAEDISETYSALISIYRHIVLGEPGGSSRLHI
jgi:hypothetical protein